jgi:hypothetical protein
MRLLLFVFTFIAFSCYSQKQTQKTMIYTIKKDMVKSFDSINFEVQLTEKGLAEISETDFSTYDYIMLENCKEKFMLLESTMSLRPPVAFIYRDKVRLLTKGDKIRLEVVGLKEKDQVQYQNVKNCIVNSIR